MKKESKESGQKLTIMSMHREGSIITVKEEIKPKQKMSKNMLKDRDFLDSVQNLQDPLTKQPEEAMPEN